MRLFASSPFTRRWPLLGLAALSIFLLAVLCGRDRPRRGPGRWGCGSSVKADTTSPLADQPVQLRAVIANPPSGAAPSYEWGLNFGDGWISWGSVSTFWVQQPRCGVRELPGHGVL